MRLFLVAAGIALAVGAAMTAIVVVAAVVSVGFRRCLLVVGLGLARLLGRLCLGSFRVF